MASFSQTFDRDYRIRSFKNSPFEKNRRKCTPKNMAEAGLYYSPTSDEQDMVVCYACGVEIYGWDKNDDPMTEHKKINADCFYLKKKISYDYELTVLEFTEIEKYRFLRLDELSYIKKRQAILRQLEKISDQLQQKDKGRSK